MMTKIVAKLKTGSIKNVIPYGYGITPANPPYVVVKRESAENQFRWRIIAHMKPGQNIAIDDYIFGEVSELLGDFVTTTRHGNTADLDRSDEYSDVAQQSSDGTISMERIFYSPRIMF